MIQQPNSFILVDMKAVAIFQKRQKVDKNVYFNCMRFEMICKIFRNNRNSSMRCMERQRKRVEADEG